jgi:hypothetical protein
MHHIDDLVSVAFSGLLPPVIDEVSDQDSWIEVRARTPGGPVACPACGVVMARVYAYE